MSKEVRHVFIRKHITYVSVFIILWTVALSHSYFQIFYAAQDLSKLPKEDQSKRIEEYENIDTVMMKIQIYASILTGFIMSLIRAREPYFRFLISKEFKSWFGILMDENDKAISQQYVNDSLATFLTSSLNVELVHVILEAITKPTISMNDPTVTYLTFLQDHPERLTETHSQYIDTIIIKNPDKWKIAKLPDFIEQTAIDTKHKQTIKKTLKIP
jgi:hypothetical protein